MPKRLGSADVIRVLQEHGFVFISQKGSHTKYRHASGRMAIIRQSGLTPGDFGF